jgi:stage III sporulation protein AF
MIAYLSEWLKKLILLVLIASFVDLILPNSAIQRYARMTIGLLIILTMLSPLLALFNLDHIKENISLQSMGFINSPPTERSYESIEVEAKRLQAEQFKAIMHQFSTSLSQEIAANLERKYETESEVEVLVSLNDKNEPKIDKILVYLLGRVHMKDNRENLADHSETIKTIPTVEIQIGRENGQQVSEPNNGQMSAIVNSVRDYLLDAYQLSPQQIEIRSE